MNIDKSDALTALSERLTEDYGREMPVLEELATADERVSCDEHRSEAGNVRIRRPVTVEDTGLSVEFIASLIGKHLYDGGVLTISQMVRRLGLAGSILETVLQFLRKEARIEIRSRELVSESAGNGLRYALTDLGRALAIEALSKDGYLGPAPVPLQQYRGVVNAQSVHNCKVTQGAMRMAFSDIVLKESMLDKLGPAVTSGRSIFIYGPAGTGKTYITQRLTRLFSDSCLIPHAIAVNDAIIPVFDPILHQALDSTTSQSELMLDQGSDPRFVRCSRPLVISGGELTIDMLNVRFDQANKLYHAPLQLKANNGLFIIDDMGRQRVSPAEIFNRWIVPMEERKDFLSLGDGRHFDVPFDEVLVFSSNINPLELADEAFLRRIGYKIHFDHLTTSEYSIIWQQECDRIGIPFNIDVLNYVIYELHRRDNIPLLPCHPRDLLNIAHDQVRYLSDSNGIGIDAINWAWENYFVQLKTV